MQHRISALVLGATMMFAANAVQARSGQVFLNAEEIGRVMEKLPPQMLLLSGFDNTTWQCQDIDVREHCGDLDGCTFNLHMQHRIDANDQVRGIKEYLYFENELTSTAKKPGLHGYTRQSAGGEHGWMTGSTGLYTLFTPWNWASAYNYRPGACPGQNGRNSAAHTDPYLLTLVSHPHLNTVITVED